MFGLDFTNFRLDLSNPIILGVTITIAGWIVTGMYAFVNQWQNMKRQLVLDVAKIKLENAHKSSNDYILLASCGNEIDDEISESPNDKNYQTGFYFLCKFFNRYQRIVDTFGGFQLDSLDAEKAVSQLVRDIFNELKTALEFETLSEMTSLITSDFNNEEINFNKFLPKLIQGENTTFINFKKLMSDKDNRKRILSYFRLLTDLLEFEVNYSYKLWYKVEPKFELNEEQIKYLKKNNLKKYAIRLKSSGKNPLVKQFYKLPCSLTW